MSRLRWDREGRDWPLRESSRFVRAGGIEWHVQQGGSGPALLLLHGTGASTHSWAPLWPLLEPHFTLIAPDLPGHGFSSQRAGGNTTLPWVARAVGDLLEALAVTPRWIVGHSAGAAVAARMALDDRAAPDALVSLAGALLPFGGLAHRLFPAVAKALFLNPLVPSLMAWRASDDKVVDRVLGQTGSTLPARQRELYARLFSHSSHVDAALALMAHWDLDALAQDLPGLTPPLTLVAPQQDGMIAPDIAAKVARMVPGAEIVRLAGLGHLAHEEAPQRVAPVILAATGVSDPTAGG